MSDDSRDMAGWEPWQRDYRFGAFYVFPPSAVGEPLDALRRQYDPKSSEICGSHVSLSSPLPRALGEADEQEIRARLAEVPAFDVTYGPLRSYPPYPGVCYDVAPHAAFERLRTVLEQCAVFEWLPPRLVPPHLTLAEFISLERTSALLAELQGRVPVGTFRCTQVDYAVPNSAFHFERVASFLLIE